MLVLTRKQCQQITIGDAITITILRVRGQSVRVGIDAPDAVHIRRGELPAFDQPGSNANPEDATAEANGALHAEQPAQSAAVCAASVLQALVRRRAARAFRRGEMPRAILGSAPSVQQ